MIALLPALLGADAKGPPATARAFGAALTLDEPTPLSTILERPEAFEKKPILLHGRISDVCQKKGCWTILRDGDATVRVRFEDYGFFLPTDAIGAEAFVEGRVKVETLSAREARHYEAESRHGNPDAVDGPRREVGFVASGVRLVRRPRDDRD